MGMWMVAMGSILITAVDESKGNKLIGFVTG